MRLGIKREDRVQVMTGREKGKSGKVLKVNIEEGRVLIEKVNMTKRHVKPNQQNPHGGILEKEAYLHISNVLLHCPKCNKGVRHGSRWVDNVAKKGSKSTKAKRKVRVCRKCSGELDKLK
jgi:large subunit ribosomal protein L24